MACAATLAWPVPHLFIPEPRTLTVSEVSDPALGQLEMGTGPDAQGLWASAHSLGLPPEQRDQWKLCTCEASRDGSAAHYSHGRPLLWTTALPSDSGQACLLRRPGNQGSLEPERPGFEAGLLL